MRFMVSVPADAASEAGVLPSEQELAEMKYLVTLRVPLSRPHRIHGAQQTLGGAAQLTVLFAIAFAIGTR